jgi:hypothetical protein
VLPGFFTGDDLTVVSSLDATPDSSSSGGIDLDLRLLGYEEIGLGLGHAFILSRV